MMNYPNFCIYTQVPITIVVIGTCGWMLNLGQRMRSAEEPLPPSPPPPALPRKPLVGGCRTNDVLLLFLYVLWTLSLSHSIVIKIKYLLKCYKNRIESKYRQSRLKVDILDKNVVPCNSWGKKLNEGPYLSYNKKCTLHIFVNIRITLFCIVTRYCHLFKKNVRNI